MEERRNGGATKWRSDVHKWTGDVQKWRSASICKNSKLIFASAFCLYKQKCSRATERSVQKMVNGEIFTCVLPRTDVDVLNIVPEII